MTLVNENPITIPETAFTYEVVSIDIESGTFEVTFTPGDDNLTPITLNTFIQFISEVNVLDEDGNQVYDTFEEVPFAEHLKYTIDSIAPHAQWFRQSTLVANSADLLGATG